AGVGHLQKGHGIAFAGLDNDGDQDIFLHSGGAVPGDSYPNSLFLNPGNSNRWIDIKFIGQKKKRAAIGAGVKVGLPEGREIHRVVNTGTSFGGSSLQQHIGLGQADRIRTLEIDWPTSKSVQTFRDIKPNQAFTIKEFASVYRAVQRRRFDL